MRLDLPLRQVVFGDDHARRLAGQPRQGLQLPIPLVALAQVDVGEPFRDRLHVAAAVADALEVAVEFLRPLRRAAGIIAGHAVDDRLETVGVVLRAHDAFQRVAADAIEQVLLVLLLARHADDPFGIGQLGGEVFGLGQLEVGLGLLAGSDVGRAGAVKIVAGGADAAACIARARAARPGSVAALGVADDADGDGRAVVFGADTTPSIAPSSAEVTWPVSAADCAEAGVDRAPDCSSTKAAAPVNALQNLERVDDMGVPPVGGRAPA